MVSSRPLNVVLGVQNHCGQLLTLFVTWSIQTFFFLRPDEQTIT